MAFCAMKPDTTLVDWRWSLIQPLTSTLWRGWKVRLGPVRVIAALDAVAGPLSASARICERLEAPRHTIDKLVLLQKLLLPCVDEKLLARFDEEGLFEPI